MKLSIPLLGACLLAASTALYAQAPQTDAGKGQRFDCSKAKDPKRCEERREKRKAAQKACAGKQGDAHRDCMRHEMCAQAKDPAQCEARAKAARERREQKK